MFLIAIDEPIGFYGSDVPWMREQLKEAKGDDVRVEISSPGGFVADGLGMYNLLKNYEGKVHVHLMGLAASMASYLAMAGDSVTAEKNAVFMIHNVWGYVSGDHREMQKASERFEALTALLAQAYVDKTGKSKKDILSLMDAETYYYGPEIKDAGFVDEVIDNDKEDNKRDSIEFAKYAVDDCFLRMKQSDRYASDAERVTAMLNLEKKIDAYSQDDSHIHTMSGLPRLDAGKNIIGGVKMTLEEIRAQHPDLYKEIFRKGVEAENKRVMAHLQMRSSITDPELMFKHIESGAQMADDDVIASYLSSKMVKGALDQRTDDDPPPVVPSGAKDKKTFSDAVDDEMFRLLGMEVQ